MRVIKLESLIMMIENRKKEREREREREGGSEPW